MDDASTTSRQPSEGNARSRYGVAFPTVSAPTTVPIAKPRAERNQVAAIFIAGGYTPARKTPVRKRSPSAAPYPSATTNAAFTAAASTALTAKYHRLGSRSARLSSAATAV